MHMMLAVGFVVYGIPKCYFILIYNPDCCVFVKKLFERSRAPIELNGKSHAISNLISINVAPGQWTMIGQVSFKSRLSLQYLNVKYFLKILVAGNKTIWSTSKMERK